MQVTALVKSPNIPKISENIVDLYSTYIKNKFNRGFQIKAFYSPDNVEEQKILLLMYFTAIPQEILNLKKAGGRIFVNKVAMGNLVGEGGFEKRKLQVVLKRED